jgi:TonB family protein
VLVAIIVAVSLHHSASAPAPQPEAAQQQTPPVVSPAPTPDPAQTPAPAGNAAGASGKGEVLNQVQPEIPAKARATIHGTVKLAMRVEVDASGNVSNAAMDHAGPSAYFARLVLASAHGWKFKPAEENGQAAASIWVIHYALRRDTTEITPVEVTP